MSRRTNNIRGRLRILEEQVAKRRREAERAGQRAARAEREVNDRVRADRECFARSVMVRVERDWDQMGRRFPLYSAMLQFSPESLVYAARREAIRSERFQVMSQMADEIGYRMGVMVAQAIVEKLMADMSGVTPQKANRSW